MSFYPSKVSKEEKEAMIYQMKFIADKHGLKLEDLEDIMMYETIGSMNPSKRGLGSASGLIQFIEKTAKGLGTTTEDLRKMSGPDQLAYVDKYLEKNLKGKTSFEELYASVAGSASVGKPSNTVMYSKDSKSSKNRKGYEWNYKNWDLNKDGKITKGEAAGAVKKGVGGFYDSIFRTEQEEKDKESVIDYFKKTGKFKKYKADKSIRSRVKKGIQMIQEKRDASVEKGLPQELLKIEDTKQSIESDKNAVRMSLKASQRKPASVEEEVAEFRAGQEEVTEDTYIRRAMEKIHEDTAIRKKALEERSIEEKKKVEQLEGSFYDQRVREAKARNKRRNEKKKLNVQNIRKLSKMGELGIRG